MRIGIHLHLYYLEQWEFFKEQLEYIDGKHGYDKILIITTSKEKKKEVRKIINGYPCNLFGLENRGYDVAPFIFALNKLKKWKPDIILKLQTKGNKNKKDKLYHNGYFYKNALKWRNRQVKGLLGSKENIDKIIRKFGNKNIGIIGGLEFQHPKLEDHYRINFIKFAKKFNLENKFKPFFAGTMFWCNWKLAEYLIKNLNFKYFYKVNKKRGVLTKAHAFEYYINTIAHSIRLQTRCIDNTFSKKFYLWYRKLYLHKKLLRIFIKVKNHNNKFIIKLFGITIYKKIINKIK